MAPPQLGTPTTFFSRTKEAITGEDANDDGKVGSTGAAAIGQVIIDEAGQVVSDFLTPFSQ